MVTIRRPGGSEYDRIGRPDLSTDDTFVETGIEPGTRLHDRGGGRGRRRPRASSRTTWSRSPILTEPLSCVTKSLRQADQVQGRLDLWEPRRALVLGAGTIGLLATLVLRLRGLEVTTVGRRPDPYRNSALSSASAPDT